MGEFSRRRAAVAATLVTGLGLLVAACGITGKKSEDSAIGNAYGTTAMIQGEVLDKGDGEVWGEVVTVRLDADAVDLKARRQDPRSLALVQGDEIELLYSRGNYREGKSYAFFISGGTGPEILALYGHDLTTDEPADEFDKEAGREGIAPVDVLDCLVELQGNTGDLRRLDAMVQALVDSYEPGVVEFSPALRACEHPSSSPRVPAIASTSAPTTTQP